MAATLEWQSITERLVPVVTVPLITAVGLALLVASAETVQPPVRLMIGQLIALLMLPLLAGMALGEEYLAIYFGCRSRLTPSRRTATGDFASWSFTMDSNAVTPARTAVRPCHPPPKKRTRRMISTEPIAERLSIRTRFEQLGRAIGQTPLVQLEDEHVELFLKLETHNLSGSVKDRPALHILSKAFAEGQVDQDTVVVESSSGNFAIALATICRALDIEFVPVIDINVNPANEQVLRTLCDRVELVTERDPTGGCLLTRLARVEQMCQELPKAYWPNQYANPWNAESHYLGAGTEICDALPRLDYVFIGVSSGGTVTGMSQIVRQRFPAAKVVAVDIEGSVIFRDQPKKRYIPGMGSSMRPPILDGAHIDEVVFVSEPDVVRGCRDLYARTGMFMGGSTGTVYQAIRSHFSCRPAGRRPVVAFLAPDRGMAYLDTVYNPAWTQEKYGM